MSKFFTYLALGLLWLLHWLPLPAFVAIGRGLGSLFYWLAAPRRKVVLTNLKLCFPHLSDAERVRLAKDHFAMVARSFLERSILWFAPEARIRRLVRFKNQERFDALVGQPVILLAPHFVGLDWGGARIAGAGTPQFQVNGTGGFTLDRTVAVHAHADIAAAHMGDSGLKLATGKTVAGLALKQGDDIAGLVAQHLHMAGSTCR